MEILVEWMRMQIVLQMIFYSCIHNKNVIGAPNTHVFCFYCNGIEKYCVCVSDIGISGWRQKLTFQLT